MSKILYFDCFSGISGDMTVGALLDLTNDFNYLKEQIGTLKLHGFHLTLERVIKNGISAAAFDVILEAHHHETEHHHESAGQLHHHDDDEKDHHHVGLSEITSLINKSGITENAKKIACTVFSLLANAESSVHGKTPDEIHFHEVGAVDSIIDIVSTAVLIDRISPDKIYFSQLNDGYGTVNCAHGLLPVPVPATAKICELKNISINITDTFGEMVTPTGAAIYGTLSAPDMVVGIKHPSGAVKKIGLGAGKKNFDNRPNLLRIMLLEEDVKNEGDIYLVETNIDDMSGEAAGYILEKLLQNGALDAWSEPIYMKKNRPAFKLCALVRTPEAAKAVSEQLISQTTTIGVRICPYTRIEAKREILEFNTQYGPFKAKKSVLGLSKKCIPEYESVRNLSEKAGIPFIEMYNMCLFEINKLQ